MQKFAPFAGKLCVICESTDSFIPAKSHFNVIDVVTDALAAQALKDIWPPISMQPYLNKYNSNLSNSNLIW